MKRKKARIILFLFILIVGCSLNIHAQSTIIKNIPEINLIAKQNSKVSLPDKVNAVMSDDSILMKKVVWVKNFVDTSRVGQIEYFGTVEGYKNKVRLTVSIKKDLEPSDISLIVSPAVVYIEKVDRFNNTVSSGSGFIVSNDGVIITNYHVIEDAFVLNVVLENQKKLVVEKVLNFDKTKDIAVLKVNGYGLPVCTLADSDKVINGQRILTIGNPQGLQNTITDGLISNNNRVIDNFRYLQTSAPISPGSSGGVLLNFDGEVVGITTASFAPGDSQNLNLSIPINIVKPYLKNYNDFTLADLFGARKRKDIVYKNGDTYSGEIVYGIPDGQGTETYINGDKYIGGFNNGVKNGRGVYYYFQGGCYRGQWLDGNPVGRGTFVNSDLTMMEGEWINGSFVEDKVEPPNVVRVKAISESEIEIGWDPLPSVALYNIYYSSSYYGPYYKFDNSQIWRGDYSCALYNIKSNTTMYFKITSLKNGKESEYSKIVSATTAKAYKESFYLVDLFSVNTKTIELTYSNKIGYDYFKGKYNTGKYRICNEETGRALNGTITAKMDHRNPFKVILCLSSPLKKDNFYCLQTTELARDIYGNYSDDDEFCFIAN